MEMGPTFQQMCDNGGVTAEDVSHTIFRIRHRIEVEAQGCETEENGLITCPCHGSVLEIIEQEIAELMGLVNSHDPETAYYTFVAQNLE